MRRRWLTILLWLPLLSAHSIYASTADGDPRIRTDPTSLTGSVVTTLKSTLDDELEHESVNPSQPYLICGNIDIRNDVRNFRKLENCSIIEGHLQIVLIDKGDLFKIKNEFLNNI